MPGNGDYTENDCRPWYCPWTGEPVGDYDAYEKHVSQVKAFQAEAERQMVEQRAIIEALQTPLERYQAFIQEHGTMDDRLNRGQQAKKQKVVLGEMVIAYALEHLVQGSRQALDAGASS